MDPTGAFPEPAADLFLGVRHMTDTLTELPREAALQNRPESPSPMEILATLAAKGGSSAEQLKIITDLIVMLQDREREKQFSEAFNACQAEMPRVLKSHENKQTGSMYSPLEAVQATCMPVATKHGFSLFFSEADCATQGYKRTVLEIMHNCGWKKTVHVDLPIDGVGAKGNAIGAMNPVQACVSTMSYGQRKAFCLGFNVVCTGDDMDGQPPGVTGTLNTEELKVIHELFERNQQTKVAITQQSFLAWCSKMPRMPPLTQIEDLPRAFYLKVKSGLEGRLREKGGK